MSEEFRWEAYGDGTDRRSDAGAMLTSLFAFLTCPLAFEGRAFQATVFRFSLATSMNKLFTSVMHVGLLETMNALRS